MKRNKGFTLIELIVAVLMFFVMVIFIISIGALVTTAPTDKSSKTQTEITQPKDSIKEMPMRSEQSEDSL